MIYGQSWPASYFCKFSFIGMQLCSSIYMLSMAILLPHGRFEELQQRIYGPQSLQYVLPGPLQKTFADSHFKAVSKKEDLRLYL